MNNKQLLIIPLLIVVYYFIHYTADLYYFIDFWKSFFQFIKYLIITGLLFFAGYKLFKNKEHFTLSFSTTLFIFLFFGSLIDTAVSIGLLQQPAGVGIAMICCFAIVCIVIAFICFRLSQGMIKKLLRFWLIYCVVLIVYDSGTFMLSTKKEEKYLTAVKETNSFIPSEKPAVFFLLFDMYPSDTVLKKYLGYDNAALGSFLKEKEFFVTGNAHTLYSETYYSLSSTLGLQPLAYFSDSTLDDYKKKLIALKNVEYASVPDIFKSSGYLLRNYSVFNLQGQQSPLQFNLNYHLDNALTSTTFFNRWYETFEPDFFLAGRGVDLGFIKKSWSSNVKNDLSFLNSNFYRLLDSFPNLNEPSFNYFHFMMPHPPIIYDSSGHELPVKDMYAYGGFDKANKNFTGYIKYANLEIKKMVNKIFEKAGKNVIIIIQGDHGYREFSNRFPDAVRYGTLNAAYLPAKNYAGFNDSMTVINTFKQVLKNQFSYNPTLE